MGKGKSITVGYTYYMGFHMGIARAIDALVQIRVGDKEAWRGNATSNTTINIDAPGLFGGEKAEGGVRGPAELMMGHQGQTASGKLKKMLSGSSNGRVPGFRGLASLYFDGMYSQMNPYPKRWGFRVRRVLSAWPDDSPWYPSRARILLGDTADENGLGAIHGMNPAHIIMYALTEPSTGRGLDRAFIDQASFRAAADTLYNEGFGLCLAWTREESVADFIQLVLDHIGGALYQDRRTGLLKLVLIRDDYNPNTLPVYSVDNGILSIEQAEVAGQPAVVNEVIINFKDPVSNSGGSVRAHNLGSLQHDAAIHSVSLDYPGLPTSALAHRVAQRELKARSVGLRRFRITFDRAAWNMEPAGVFRLTDVSRGLSNIVLRIVEYDDGTMNDGTITITAVQDIFAFQLSAFTEPQENEHIPPDLAPALARRVVYEIPYVQLVSQMPIETFERLEVESGLLGVGAEQPTGAHMGYEIHTRREGETGFSWTGRGNFIPLCELDESLDYLTTTVRVRNTVDVQFMAPDMAVMVDGEVMAVRAIEWPDLEDDGAPANGDDAILTLSRGACDTVPARHGPGALVWFYDEDIGTDEHEYFAGESVEVKVLPWTLQGGTFPADDAPIDIVSFNYRYARPYPPGHVLLNDEPWYVPATLGDERPLQLEWAHRDRVGQVDRLIGHEEGNIGPEPGTRYHVTVRDEDGRRIYDNADIQGTSWGYDLDSALADLGEANTNEDIRRTIYLNLESRRTVSGRDLGSWQSYDMVATVAVYRFWLRVASLARNVAIADELPDPEGVYVAQLARNVAIADELPDPEGVYVAQLARPVGQRTSFPETPDRLVMERPYLLQLRAGASLLAHNVVVAAAQPLDGIPDHYTLYSALNPEGEDSEGRPPARPAPELFRLDDAEVRWARWGISEEAMLYDTSYINIVMSSGRRGLSLADVPVGTLIAVDNEIMSVTEAFATQLRVQRGVADTIPARHSANARVWVLQTGAQERTGVSRNHPTERYVGVKLLPQQFAGPIDLSETATDQLYIDNRVSRPYPPGRVLVNGGPWYNGASALEDSGITLTWVDRNRVTQGVRAVGHGAPGIPREPGTVYVIELSIVPRGAQDRLVLREDVVDGNSWHFTYAEAQAMGRSVASRMRQCGSARVTLRLWARRDGLLSWQPYVVPLSLPAPRCTGSNGTRPPNPPYTPTNPGTLPPPAPPGRPPGDTTLPPGSGNLPNPQNPEPPDDDNQHDVDPGQDPNPVDPNDEHDSEGNPQLGFWSRNWGNQWAHDVWPVDEDEEEP